MDALIIKKPWIDYIFKGEKIWEIRGCNTHKRGKIELIESGSGLVVGCCKLIDCFKLNLKDFKKNFDKHCVDMDTLPYRNTYAWVLSNIKKYDKPRKYNHPLGAIIWVKLKNESII